jgi:hypothetical protein
VAEAGDHRGCVEGTLLAEGLPHGAGGSACPGHEDHVRLGVNELAGERGQFLSVRDEDRFHGGALGAEDGL